MRSTIQRDLQFYLASTAVLSAVNLVRNLLVSRLLGPYDTGLASSFLAIPQIGQYVTLVIIAALPVVIPREAERGEALRRAVFNFTMLASSLIFLGIVAYSLLRSDLSTETRWFLAAAGCLMLLWDVSKFFTYSYAAERQFVKLGWIEFGFSVLMLVLHVAAIERLGITGFWVGYLVANLLLVVYCWRDYVSRHPLRIGRFEVKRLLPLGATGLGLLLASETVNLFTVPAKIVVAFTLGATEVGYFTISILVLSKLSIIPRAIATVITPHVSGLIHRADAPNDVWWVFIRTQLVTAVSATVIILPGLLVIGLFIELVLPDFLPSVPMARIMLCAGIPFTLITNANQILIAAGRNRLHLQLLVAALAFQFAVLTAFYFQGFTPFKFALSYVAVFTVYCLMTNGAVLRTLREQPSATNA